MGLFMLPISRTQALPSCLRWFGSACRVCAPAGIWLSLAAVRTWEQWQEAVPYLDQIPGTFTLQD